jgi:hypothetical protein
MEVIAIAFLENFSSWRKAFHCRIKRAGQLSRRLYAPLHYSISGVYNSQVKNVTPNEVQTQLPHCFSSPILGDRI